MAFRAAPHPLFSLHAVRPEVRSGPLQTNLAPSQHRPAPSPLVADDQIARREEPVVSARRRFRSVADTALRREGVSLRAVADDRASGVARQFGRVAFPIRAAPAGAPADRRAGTGGERSGTGRNEDSARRRAGFGRGADLAGGVQGDGGGPERSGADVGVEGGSEFDLFVPASGVHRGDFVGEIGAFPGRYRGLGRREVCNVTF